MGTNQNSTDSPPGQKKRRRVGFSDKDAGIEANECISIYLVFSKDEVGSPKSFKIEPVDLNHFFEDDGKLYGYQSLKVVIWLSGISFHAFADISYESSSDGGKGVTDLKSSLSNIFADNLVWSKDEFLQTFSTDCNYIKSVVSNAELLPKNGSNGCGDNTLLDENSVDIFRVRGTWFGNLYCRLVPLVLLLVDGSNPIDVTCPRWEIYLLTQRYQNDSSMSLLGFAAAYRFHKYPSSTRLRLGQILIMPTYQRKGYGSHILKVLNNVATSEDMYDFTIEEPVDAIQHARTYIDVERLLTYVPLHDTLTGAASRMRNDKNFSKEKGSSRYKPPADIIEEARKSFKITKRQFLNCWEILLYLKLMDQGEQGLENYATYLVNRVENEVIGKESEGAGKVVIDIPTEFDGDASFFMCKVKGEQSSSFEKDEECKGINQEENLRQLVDERMKEIRAVVEKIYQKSK